MLLDTPVCDFGWQAPHFSLQDPNGKHYSLTDQIGKNGLLIAFICNHCPYVKSIATRFAQDSQLLIDQGVNVLAIMSNDYLNYDADSPANMQRFAAQHHFNFPYLVDEEQAVGKAYGAICTPDFFGFNNKGELQYRGRLDDANMKYTDKRIPELVNAMLQVSQTGQGPKQQTPSMGCSIKWRD